MKQPGITIFLYILGGISLLGGCLAFIGGISDAIPTEIAIGVSATIEGAVLLALGKIVSLLSNISNPTPKINETLRENYPGQTK